MSTKSRKATTKPAIKSFSGGQNNRRGPTKGDRLIQLLKTSSGRDIAAVSAKLDWQPHTTRAAISRLRKAGYVIEKLPPGKQGGTRYRISGAPAGPARPAQ